MTSEFLSRGRVDGNAVNRAHILEVGKSAKLSKIFIMNTPFDV